MTKKAFRNILAIPLFIGVALLLFTSCPNTITPPDPTGTGYFDVDLVITGSIDGEPYFQEISFSDSTRTVALDVSYKLDSVDIQSTKEVSGASLKVNGRSIDYGNSVAVALETGTNTILVKVTPDLVDAFDYTLKLKRGVAPGETLSNDATLSSLVICNLSIATLDPVFSPDHFEYYKAVTVDIAAITIIAESNDENADITINGDAVDSGDEAGPYTVETGRTDNAIEITVTAEDEVTVEKYIIDIFRMSTVDTGDPVITLIGGNPYPIEVHSSWSEPGYSAYDNEEAADLTASVDVDTHVNTELVGSGYVVYTVSDQSGRTTTVTRDINVLDTTDPVITLNGTNPMRVDKGSEYNEPGATVSDNYDTGITYGTTGSVDTSVETTYQVTYSATDSSGNTTSVIRNVVVSNDSDSEPPVLTLLGDNPYHHEVNTEWNEPGYTAIDAADGNLHGSVAITGSVDTTTLGSIILQYNVSDSSGNAAVQQNRTVIVEDTTPPEISLIGSSEITVAHGSSWTDPGVLITDNYDTGLTATVIGSVNPNAIASYPILYRVNDNQGNDPAEVSRIVHVTDQTPPHISYSGDTEITIALGGTFTEPWAAGGITASDNVDGNITSDIEITGDTVDTETPGTYTLYYDVLDTATLAADTLTLTVTVEDQDPPVITLNGASVIEVEFGSNYADQGATAVDNWDNSGNPWPVTSPVIVDTSHVGDYILTYDATDAAGNSAVQVTRTVMVLNPPDTIAPQIFLNGNSTVYVEYPNTYTDQGAIATDQKNEDPYTYNITSDIVVTDNIDYGTVGTYKITYYVEDQAAPPNSATIDRTVIVQDTTDPVITISGGTEQDVDYGSSFTAPTATANDTYDGAIPFSSFTVNGAGSVDTDIMDGSYEVTYSVTDSHGNTATATLTVTIEDLSAPVISLLGNSTVTVECGDVYADAGAEAEDTYEGDISGSIAVTGLPISTSIPGTHTVSYDISDTAGNAADTVTRTVNVVDTTAPVLTLLESDEITVEVFSDWPSQAPDCMITDNDTRTYGLDIVTNGLDMDTVGVQNVTYTLSDISGNAATPIPLTVTVVDNAAPVISLTGSSSITLDYGSSFTDPGATASDTYDDSKGIDVNVTVSGDTVLTSSIGTYTIYYDAVDSSLNAAATVSRTVTVSDLSAPVITVLGNAPEVIECLDTYTDAGASAFDTLDGDLTEDIITTGDTIDTSAPGTYTVTYQVTDDAGHTVTATRTVNVVDTTDPVITLTPPLSLTVEVNTLWSAWEPGFTVYDEIDSDLSNDDVELSGLDMGVLGTQTLNYDAADASGNDAATKSRTVTVVDTTPPEITLLGAAEITINVGDSFSDPGATVWDNYNGDWAWTIYSGDSVDTETAGTYDLAYRATDSNSNTAEEIRTVIVQ